MKALTVWQPWATLIVLGAKAWEFRGWDYRTRAPRLVGQRIAIHAGARAMRIDELVDLEQRIAAGDSALEEAVAGPLVKRLIAATDVQRRSMLARSAVIGSAVIGEPAKVSDIFRDVFDSDRLDHSKWGWPMREPRRWAQPLPWRGFQGFWSLPDYYDALDADANR